MDKRKKESAEHSQAEPSGTESTEPNQSESEIKIESLEKDSTDTESNGLDNKAADAESSNPDAKPVDTSKTDRADSTESGQTDEQEGSAGHPPDNAALLTARDTGKEKSGQSDMKEAAAGKGDEDSSAADESAQKADTQDIEHAEPVDGDPDTKKQSSQPSNAITDDEPVAVDSVNQNEIENDAQQSQAAIETAESTTDDTDPVNTDLDPSVESVSTDGDADQTDQQQVSPEKEASLESQQESQTDEDTLDDTVESPPGDNDQQVVAAEKETASQHSDSEAQAVDGTGAQKDPAAESEAPDEAKPDSDQTQGASKEASTPQANAETQSEADDVVTDAAAPDHDDTKNQKELDNETAEQALEAAASKTSIVKITVSALLITAVFSGFFIFENKSKTTKNKTVAEAPSKEQPQPLKHAKNQIVDIPSAVNPSIYDDPINEVSVLRDTLLKKQAEVLALTQRYLQSIEELEKEILDAQRKADVQTFLQASNHNRIVFSLKTIQRRQAYIRQLEKPLEWVSGACEELLYIKRRVLTDLQVSAIASGIDMDRHVQKMHWALKEYRPTADKLAIDPTDARLESLETIWQRIQNEKDVVSAESVYSKNQIISAQICAGNYNRIGELSEMTTSTAKCITEMQASDLFLNQVTEISPATARQLCQWKGSWICMNGIRVLSPRVAHYLFQWDGHWISLNGLAEFPAEIGEALLRWQGRQLELMGLLDTADAHARIGIEYLAEWERSGGKLFVPENIRKKIDALHQHSG